MRVKRNRVVPRMLSAIGNGVIAIAAHPGHDARSVYAAFKKFDELQQLTDSQLRRSAHYIVGSKYIVITKTARGSTIRLSEKGKELLGRYAIEHMRIKAPQVWDKKWRLVLFDIPEALKKRRDGFAKSLKELGLVQIQKSVFTHPHPCLEEVEVLAAFHKVERFVQCATAHMEPGRMRSLEKLFSLHG